MATQTRPLGTNQRALGLNPRATKTNPRSLGVNPQANETYLVRITAPHFCAGIVVFKTSNCVSRAAPILRWSTGKAATEVLAYCARKRWKAEIVAPPP